ncbi:hypothetical protein HGA88_05630 [Candidatus Roizmanbacteria bacterium]|nr:hypothetical protein [Candidatus Roizmanbacteria bacterium]
MLTIICGEDSIASRAYLSQLKVQYQSKQYEIQSVAPSELETVYKSAEGTLTLFGAPIIYVVENLQKAYTRSKKGTFAQIIQELAKNPEIEVIDWEEGKSQRDVSLSKLGTAKEFKPEKSIFQLLDLCYPGNKVVFTKTLEKVANTQDEGFIFAMLARHIRTLVLAFSEALPSSIPSWQRAKLYGQAKKWDGKKLVEYYEALAKIDSGLKSSSNVHGYKNSLDILSVYYL